MAMSQTEKEQKGVFDSDYHPDQNPVPDVGGQQNVDIVYPIDFKNYITPVTCLQLNHARLEKDKIYIDDRQVGMLQLVALVERISSDDRTWRLMLQDDHSSIMARYFVTGKNDYWLAILRTLQQGDVVTVHGQMTFGEDNERYIHVYGIRDSDKEAEKYTAMAKYSEAQTLQHEESENKVEPSSDEFAAQWQRLHAMEVESRQYWKIIEPNPVLWQRLKEIEEKEEVHGMSTASKSSVVPQTAQVQSSASAENNSSSSKQAHISLSEQFERSVSVSVDALDKSISGQVSSVLGKEKSSAHFAAREVSSPSEPPAKKHKK